MSNKPKFDPTKPYEPADEVVGEKPKFDPALPFQAIESNQIEASAGNGAMPGGAELKGAGAGLASGLVAQGAAKLTRAAGGLKETLGRLSNEDMKYISDDVGRYNKAQELEGLLKGFQDNVQGLSNKRVARTGEFYQELGNTAKNLHQKGYDFASEAKLSAKGLPKISRNDLYKSVADVLADQGKVSVGGSVTDFTPEDKSNYVRSTVQSNAKPLNEITTQLDEVNTELTKLQSQGPNADLKRLTEMMAEKRNLKDKLLSMADQTHRDALSSVDSYTGIPESIVKQNAALQVKKLAPGYSLNDVMNIIGPDDKIDPERVAGRMGIISDLQMKPLEGGESTDTKFRKAISDKIKDDFRSNELYKEYDEKQTMSSKAIRAAEELEELGIKLDDQGNPVFSATTQNKISQWMDDPQKYAGEIERLEKALAEAQDLGITTPGSYQDIQALRSAENRFAAAGINPNSQTEDMEFTRSNQKKFLQDVTSGQGSEFDNIKKAFTEDARLQGIPENEIEKVFAKTVEDVNLGRIKGISKGTDLSNAFQMRARGKAAALPLAIGAMIGGGSGAAGGGGLGAGIGTLAGGFSTHYAIEKYGTQIQEALAKAQGSTFGKGANKLINTLADTKLLPGLGLVVGGVMGAKEAQAAGLSPVEQGIAAAGDAISPIPFSSTTQGILAARALPESQIPELDSLAVDLTGKPEPNQREQDAFMSGFTKPLRELSSSAGGMAVDGLEAMGTAKSNVARSRMEQNLNAFRQLRRGDKSAVVGPEEMNPDQLNALSQEFQAMGGGAAGFAENLAKAARAEDEDARNRILHGLSQQTGFRALMNRRN